jgi:hypothetical protein
MRVRTRIALMLAGITAFAALPGSAAIASGLPRGRDAVVARRPVTGMGYLYGTSCDAASALGPRNGSLR